MDSGGNLTSIFRQQVPDMLCFFPDLRRATIPIFYDMMKVEYHQNHDFKKVTSLDVIWLSFSFKYVR